MHANGKGCLVLTSWVRERWTTQQVIKINLGASTDDEFPSPKVEEHVTGTNIVTAASRNPSISAF